jgi:toxin ParE1/3/4
VIVEWSASALADLDRFAVFLHQHFPHLADRIATALKERALQLADHPRLGRAIAGRDEYRQVVLRALNAAYVFQYRIDGERVVILRVLHGRESGG